MMLILSAVEYTSASSATLDTSFNTGIPVGFWEGVTDIVVKSDNKMIIGGNINTYKGIPINYIVGLNADGTIDPNFNVNNGFNNSVSTVKMQSDGKILVGGGFTEYDNTIANRIIRLNTDGSKDSSFLAGAGFSSRGGSIYVRTIAIQNDGKILVGGEFSTYNGESISKIVRLNIDGTIDSSFVPAAVFGSEVISIFIQSDGKILVGGAFSSKLTRLNSDGSIDTGFNVGSNFNTRYGAVFDIAVQSDGKIVAVGATSSYQPNCLYDIIRLNTDGSKDSSFDIGSGFSFTVHKVRIQSDNKIIVGGEFGSYKGVAINKIIRLTTTGAKDTTFNVGNGFNNAVFALAIRTDGKILVGGSFTSYSGFAAKAIVRLNTNGTPDNSLNIGNGVNDEISTITVQGDGKILVGGAFTSYKGIINNRLMRLKADGSLDTGFNIGGAGINTPFSNMPITAITLQSDGKILVGGTFLAYNGVTIKNLVRINTDGSKDSSFNIGSLFTGGDVGWVNQIAVQSDGKILVGGEFSTFNRTKQRGLVRLNTNGTQDTGFNMGSGFNPVNPSNYGDEKIYALTVQSDGKILVGGNFTSYSGVTANRIVRLNADSTRDSSFSIGNGFNGYVEFIKIQSDGKILVAGEFTSYNGVPANKIIRLNTDGSRDTSFSPWLGIDGSTDIKSLYIQNNSGILIGGRFSNNRYGLVRLTTNGSKDISFDMMDGVNGWVNGIAEKSDGKIIIGGAFSEYNSNPAANLVTLYGETNVVILPDSVDSGVVSNAFTSQGYVETDGKFDGVVPISLGVTDGNIPLSLDITNQNLNISIPGDTRIKKSDNITNYNGIISVPIVKNISSVNDQTVIISFNVGGSSNSISLAGGSATISVPVPGQAIGSWLQVYYSQDSGVTRHTETITQVIDKNGESYIEFDTNHLADFAITTLPAQKFEINNNETSTVFPNVTLSMYTTPAAAKMRFSNNNTDRSSWENYTTTKSWTISGFTDIKTVYAQFDTDNNGTADIYMNDTIIFDEADTIAPRLYLNGDSNIVFNQGDSYLEYGAIAIDNVNGDISSNIIISGSVNTNSSGVYLVSYKVTDADGNTASPIIRTITVNADPLSPVISILGEPSLNIIQGSSYIDSGAVALDNLEGNITSRIVTSGSVNTTIPGTYIITYNVSDLVGNPATEVTRYVTVVALGSPTASITYSTTTTTNQDVVATITGFSTQITGLNATGHIFTGNGIFIFTFQDLFGNTGSITANVTWINKTVSGGGSNSGGGNSSSSSITTIKTTIASGTTGVMKPIGNIINSPFSIEFNNAYLWAFSNNITTKDTIQKANMTGTLIRTDMAKMISNFAINVLHKVPSTGTTCNFADIKSLSGDTQHYMILACKLGLMGLESNGKTVKKNFEPFTELDRGQFGTILSRLLRSNKYNGGDPYYTKHLNALKSAGIMTKITTPLQKEIRGYVMLMMQRATAK